MQEFVTRTQDIILCINPGEVTPAKLYIVMYRQQRLYLEKHIWK